MARRTLFSRVAILVLSCAIFGAGWLHADAPNIASADASTGLLQIEVVHDPDGRVLYCRVVRSTAPQAVENFAIAYITNHWSTPLFAGQTEIFPISFAPSPMSASDWNADLTPPPGLHSPSDPARSLKLRLTFGKDGWVGEAMVLQPSGSDVLDNETSEWVKAHWHHAAYAGQVVDAPFKFEPPVIAPALPTPPPKPKKTPPPVPLPPSNVPIPAERAL